MKKISSSVMALVVAGVVFSGCATATQPIAQSQAGQQVYLAENLSCGKAFPASGWARNYQFAFEVMDKTSKGQGFKVKTLANINGQMIHLECERSLPSYDAAMIWLTDNGYQFESHGSEKGGASGIHRTVNRGHLYTIPSRLYQR